MIFPTVHLNGTNKSDLLDQLGNAYAAVGDAITALEEASPNGRDYYPQGEGALPQAIEEHRTRVVALKNVQDELYAISEKVDATV